jgi:Ca2+-binding EF-hand superfamily protein
MQTICLIVSETEIKFLVKRFLCLDPTGTQGVAIDDILDLPELALNPVVAGLVPLYATWDEEDPKDRDKARVHLSNFIHMMSLLSPKTSVKEKLQSTTDM